MQTVAFTFAGFPKVNSISSDSGLPVGPVLPILSCIFSNAFEKIQLAVWIVGFRWGYDGGIEANSQEEAL